MKRFFYLAAIVLISSLSTAVQAKSWRINNDPAAKADFLSINDAMASNDVYPGDVLYLDPACRLPEQTITKGVTIIGTGYNLVEAEEAMVEGIRIGANNIKLTGINVTGWIRPGGGSDSSFDRLVVERCKLKGFEASGRWDGNILKTDIIGCYIIGDVIGSGLSLFLRNSIVIGYVSNAKNSIISNNVVIYDSENAESLSFAPLRSITNSTITNNIIINTTTHTTTTDNVVTNWNYMTIQNTAVTDYNTINNNVLSTDAEHVWADFPTNKFIGAKVEDIFVNEGNQEEKYKLKEGSAAIGYGTNGVDCGAFDGMYPYVLCGRPQFVPYIYEAQIPNNTTDGKLKITLKVKTQNE